MLVLGRLVAGFTGIIMVSFLLDIKKELFGVLRIFSFLWKTHFLLLRNCIYFFVRYISFCFVTDYECWAGYLLAVSGIFVCISFKDRGFFLIFPGCIFTI